PVENVALLPWLVTTAFLHSVVIQERRGMLKVWNLSLVVGAFALTTFGTFLTRGSILSSVHSFARSAVGPMYLGFLVLVLLVGFGLIAAQSWRLRSEGRFDSALSRETTFLGNNLVLLAVFGMRDLAAVAALGLAAFVAVANIAEIVRGVRTFARATGHSLIRSGPTAVARNRRLYGGLVAHVGIAVAAAAITVSSAFAH